ncbi:MAG: hypothetical protein INF79_02395 [Roseomonas sp.]|nr:hypothetical protein [Roseomonas sp.]
MSRLKLVGKAMMLINGAFNGLDQTLGQFGSYELLSIERSLAMRRGIALAKAWAVGYLASRLVASTLSGPQA